MTDEEIIQVLRICATHIEKGCGLCPQMKYVRCTERLADEAITMIERLTAENAALREKRRWIPVEEKTPEYDMPQLALNADGDALIANYAYGEWFDTWGQDVEVTHWLPLPEAPEGGGKA